MTEEFIKKIIMFLKVFSFLYVIPLYHIIGVNNNIKFSYVFIIILFYMVLFSNKISKYLTDIFSYYHEKQFYYTKNFIFKLTISLFLLIGFIIYGLIIISSYFIFKNIFNYQIGIASLLIFMLPIYEIIIGYLKGSKYNLEASLINLIKEGLFVILPFGILLITLFGFKQVVNCGLMGFVIGILLAYGLSIGYGLFIIIKKINKGLEIKKTRGEVKIKVHVVLKETFTNIGITFFINSIVFSYLLVSNFSTIQNLTTYFNYSSKTASITMSVINMWGLSLNCLLIFGMLYFINKIIYNVGFLKQEGRLDIIRDKINKALQVMAYSLIPSVVILSCISKELWILFYTQHQFAATIISVYFFEVIFIVLYYLIMLLLVYLKHYKVLFASSLIGLIFKILLNAPLMLSLYKIGYEPYGGIILSSIIGYTVSAIIGLRFIYVTYKLNISNTVTIVLNVIFSTVVTASLLLIFKRFVGIESSSMIINSILIIIYVGISTMIYYYLTKKNMLINQIFKKK